MPDAGLRVLIVDDTVVYRKILSDVAGEMQGVSLVQSAPQGRAALTRMKQQPFDIVLLDVEMPDMDGLETLAEIRKSAPDTAVVMISGVTARARDNTVRALEIGAMDFLAKPDGNDVDANRNALRDKLRPLFRHVQTRLNLRSVVGAFPPPAPAPPPPAPLSRVSTATAFDVLAVGVSTGGPNALAELIPRLPRNLGVPVLLVQHMPPGFTASLAQHLNERSALRVREAQEGEALEANTVYIAPGGRHMTIRRFTPPGCTSATLVIGLNDNPPENSCRPSVDVLFRSVASHYEGRVLAVIMTGMGSDGLEGVRALKRKGARVLTQSEDTCVVYGMPMAVDEAGLSDESLPLPRLAGRIEHLLRR